MNFKLKDIVNHHRCKLVVSLLSIKDFIWLILDLALIVLDVVTAKNFFKLLLLFMIICRDDSGTFCVNLFEKFFLSWNISLFDLAEGFNCLIPNFIASMKRKPFYTGKELGHLAVDFLIVTHRTKINFNIILSYDTHWLQVSVFNIQAAALFGFGVRSLESFGPFITVVKIESLKTIDSIFLIIFPLCILLGRLNSYSLKVFRSYGMMSPS